MTDTGTGWLTCPNAATCVVVRRTVACSEPGMLHPDCEDKYHPKVPVIVVGDSKRPAQRPLVFTLPEWAELVCAVKAGKHDALLEEASLPAWLTATPPDTETATPATPATTDNEED